MFEKKRNLLRKTATSLKMKKTVIVSSPGKLIIGGEHAVVYGRRALVTSVGMRMYMQLTEEEKPGKERFLTIHFRDTETRHSIELSRVSDAYPMEVQAILFVYRQFQPTLSSGSDFDLQVRSEIPIGAGLGSSAAFSVCLVGCFFRLSHHRLQADEINALAYRVECLFHGTPSGIDNTISTFGQSLLYSRTAQKHLDFRIPNLAILDTGLPKSTKGMVALVRQFADSHPEEAEEIFGAIELAVDTMIEHPEQLDSLFRRNQQLLARLGVSIPAIDQISDRLAEHGIACKITGAGGGGCLIALLAPSMKDQLLDWLKEKPIKSVHFVECGVEGLREEPTFLTS